MLSRKARRGSRRKGTASGLASRTTGPAAWIGPPPFRWEARFPLHGLHVIHNMPRCVRFRRWGKPDANFEGVVAPLERQHQPFLVPKAPRYEVSSENDGRNT